MSEETAPVVKKKVRDILVIDRCSRQIEQLDEKQQRAVVKYLSDKYLAEEVAGL